MSPSLFPSICHDAIEPSWKNGSWLLLETLRGELTLATILQQ